MIRHQIRQGLTNIRSLPLRGGLRGGTDTLRKERVLLFASPRGGSTWLAEMIAKGSRGILVNEPLKRHKLRSMKAIDTWWHQPLPLEAEWPAFSAKLDAVFDLKQFPQELYFDQPLVSFKRGAPVVFKMCYGNLMMPWLLDRYTSKAILLVRHPCAVVASQLKHSAWSGIPDRFDAPSVPACRFWEFFVPYRKQFNSVNRKEDYLALIWGITVAYAFEEASRNPDVLILSYEELLTAFESEVARVFDHLGQERPKNLSAIASRPSSSSQNKGEISNEERLAGWKDQLPGDLQQRILDIARNCGVEFYDEEVMPRWDKQSTEQ